MTCVLAANDGRTEEVASSGPEVIRIAGPNGTVSITMEDVSAYHGHPCPGSEIAFRGFQLASRILWDESIPQRDDIAILCHGPMYGVLDVFALVTRGPIEPKADAISQPSNVLEGMPVSPQSFVFTVIRRSTGEAIDLRVRNGVYPDEFFALRQKAQKELASPTERDRLKALQKEMIEKVKRAEIAELFEPVKPYRVVMFGT